MIAIFGGTFDPVHLGHLALCERACKTLPIETVYFVPLGSPVHREAPLASAEDRVRMLKLALKNYPHFKIDTREVDRDAPSYMIDTVKSFALDFPNQKLALIIGSDQYLRFKTWKSWQEILKKATLIVIKRPGFEPLISDIPAVFIPGKCEVSSTVIREQHQWEGLNSEVRAYVEAHHLYPGKTSKDH